MDISKRIYFNTQRSRDSSKCLLSGKRHSIWWESKKPSVIISIQWKPLLWVGESNASTHTCCMHTSMSRRNADFCIWEQLLSEMERPTDGCIVIVGGGGEGSYFGCSVEFVCVCVSVCLTGCVLHYLDLSGVFKGFYSLGILKPEQALEILACNGEGERSRTHSC